MPLGRQLHEFSEFVCPIRLTGDKGASACGDIFIIIMLALQKQGEQTTSATPLQHRLHMRLGMFVGRRGAQAEWGY
jgi:hypothetical protein